MAVVQANRPAVAKPWSTRRAMSTESRGGQGAGQHEDAERDHADEEDPLAAESVGQTPDGHQDGRGSEDVRERDPPEGDRGEARDPPRSL